MSKPRIRVTWDPNMKLTGSILRPTRGGFLVIRDDIQRQKVKQAFRYLVGDRNGL